MIKEAAGRAPGDAKLTAEGKSDRAEGRVRPPSAAGRRSRSSGQETAHGYSQKLAAARHGPSERNGR